MAKTTGTGKSAQFNLFAPGAKKVSLAGNFNNWDTNSLGAKKDTKGNWSVKVNLKPGKYEYKFFVDGTWTMDPSSKSCVCNNLGSQNSVIEIK